MLNKNNNLLNLVRLRRASWLALLSLAWMQFAFASHQLEHDAQSLTETCEVCVHLDRLGDGVTGQVVEAGLALSQATERPPSMVQLVAEVPHRGFDSRAPPYH